MNYGLYISSSGLLTNSYRQDVFANNLANVNTVGFKPDLATVQSRAPKSAEDNLGMDVSGQLMERLGGGVYAAPQRTSFAQGAPEATGRAMDVYLEDPLDFLQVQAPGAGGRIETQLTRDGRLMTNDQGQLVTPQGHPVLDAKGRGIDLPPGIPTRIGSEGWITDNNGLRLAQVGVVNVSEPTMLKKAGGNRFMMVGDAGLQALDAPQVRGGTLESSAVDPIAALMQVINATKAATGNARMIRYHDTVMDQAINTLGRVA
ncbi:MAG: flagellar hook-basal body protein [Planctomycetota bacterium]